VYKDIKIYHGVEKNDNKYHKAILKKNSMAKSSEKQAISFQNHHINPNEINKEQSKRKINVI
jgi:hypothetical protein